MNVIYSLTNKNYFVINGRQSANMRDAMLIV